MNCYTTESSSHHGSCGNCGAKNRIVAVAAAVAAVFAAAAFVVAAAVVAAVSKQ